MTPKSNPVTPAGYAAMKARYDHLLGTERPEIVEIVSWAAGNGDRSENGDYLYGRKRMREILKELQVPQGMSVIMRTAGVSRTKAEIKRDLDYLMKLWDGIRSTTLESTAPALIHEEGSLVRRAIRDIYTRDIDEIIEALVQHDQAQRLEQVAR